MDDNSYEQVADQAFTELRADLEAATDRGIELFEEWLNAGEPMVLKPDEYMITSCTFAVLVHDLGVAKASPMLAAFLAWLGYRQKEEEIELERMADDD